MPDFHLLLHWFAKYLPMKDPVFSFTDVVTGKPVFEFTERFTERPCLANHRWSWERVYLDTPFEDLRE